MLYHPCAGDLRPAAIILDIIDGKAWTARSIRQNNLRQHCHQFARIFRQATSLADLLRPMCRQLLLAIVEKSDLLTTTHPKSFPLAPVLVRIAAYSSRWVRDPGSWSVDLDKNNHQQLTSLIRHLFVTWDVPEFFDSAWWIRGDLMYLERDWYCHFARGGSLRKVQGMPPSITSRALHLAMSAPAHLTIREALRWGQIKSLDGSAYLLAEVLSSQVVQDLSNDEIWSRLFEKMAVVGEDEAKNFGLIADALKIIIARNSVNRARSLLDLPLADLVKFVRKFWKNLVSSACASFPGWSYAQMENPEHRANLCYQYLTEWEPMIAVPGFVAKFHDGAREQPCTIEELTFPAQLVAEGKVMHHCVGSYVQACRHGKSAIFSLRTAANDGSSAPWKSHITIEVDRSTRKIVQIRGKNNRLYGLNQIPPLRQWAEAVELQI